MGKYEIKTMPKDIEELGSSAAQETDASKKENSSSSQVEQNEPPKELPIVSEEIKKLAEEQIKEDVKEEPIKSSEPKTEYSEEKEKDSGFKSQSTFRKIIIPIIIAVIILLAGGGVYYWYNYLREPGTNNLSPDFIEVDSTKVLEVQVGEENRLLGELRKEVFETQPINTLKQTVVRQISEVGSEIMPLCDLFNNLTIATPFSCLEVFGKDNEYMFLYYSQEEGIRSGFIAKIKDREYLNNFLQEWETTMRTDLGPVFLGQETGMLANEEFQTGNYKGTNMRYLNFVDSSFAIDYAVINDYFVVATSKDSMFEMVDRVLGE